MKALQKVDDARRYATDTWQSVSAVLLRRPHSPTVPTSSLSTSFPRRRESSWWRWFWS